MVSAVGVQSTALADSDDDHDRRHCVHEDSDEHHSGQERRQKEIFGAIEASISCVFYDRATHTFDSILTLKNTGPTFYAPVVKIRTETGVAVIGGASNDGHDLFTLKVLLPNGSLLPNESVRQRITFSGYFRDDGIPKLASVTGASAPAGLGIIVTSPTSGQTPDGPTFVVTGTLTAPGVAGVSVDGIPACVVGSTFFVNAFTPQVAPTSFSAAANDIDGGQVATSVKISPSSKGLRLSPSPACGGIAPLATTLAISLDATDGDTITALTIDFGTGAGPQSVSLSNPIQNTYASAGFYTVNVTATTALGATLTQSAMISVLTPTLAFEPILKNVSLLQNALAGNNVLRALSYHSYASQSRYAALLTQAGINLPGLGTLLSTAQPVVLVGNYAEVVVTTTGTNPQSSSVVLVRDGGGNWRVDSW
jgi:hypothetical protein